MSIPLAVLLWLTVGTIASVAIAVGGAALILALDRGEKDR